MRGDSLVSWHPKHHRRKRRPDRVIERIVVRIVPSTASLSNQLSEKCKWFLEQQDHVSDTGLTDNDNCLWEHEVETCDHPTDHLCERQPFLSYLPQILVSRPCLSSTEKSFIVFILLLVTSSCWTKERAGQKRPHGLEMVPGKQ